MESERLFRNFSAACSEPCRRSDVLFLLNWKRGEIMNKFGLIAAAVAAIAIAAPSVASAEKIVIKRGGEHHYGARPNKVVIKTGHRDGARAEYRGRRDYGMHRGHGGKKVVIIKHGRDHRY
jgi:hypothetical protein